MVGKVAPSVAQTQKRGPSFQNHDVLVVSEGPSKKSLPAGRHEEVIGQGCEVRQLAKGGHPTAAPVRCRRLRAGSGEAVGLELGLKVGGHPHWRRMIWKRGVAEPA